MKEQGQPVRLSADRYMEDHGHYRLTPWSAQCSEFREADGMYIPTHFDVTRLHADISKVEYDRSGKVTKF